MVIFMEAVVDVQAVYEELKFIRQHMVLKKDLCAFIDTMEILRNTDTIKQITESEKDISSGRTRTARSVRDILRA